MNYYETLGISKDATQEDIKKAYRKLAIQHHPDKGGDENKFKEIAVAYETLGDETKRQQYNYKLDNPNANMFGGNPFEGPSMDDIFSQMFGDRFGRQQQQRRAPDKVIEVQISVLETYNGTTKNINFSRKTPCDVCSGNGGDKAVCNTCNGNGHIVQRAGTGMFTQIITSACPTCSGSGYTVKNACHGCLGTGSKNIIENLNITFPKNVDNGQMLRVPQKGDFHQGMNGDLILRVIIVNDNGFEKSSNDLIYNVFFNLEDLNKNDFEVPHPDGKISVKFPKEFNTQIPLRIKYKGFVNGNNIGDLYIKMNVKFTKS
jgi:molecular chaperone DnaJ